MSKFFGDESLAEELLKKLKEFKKPEVKKCGSACWAAAVIFLFIMLCAAIICAVKLYIKHRDECECFKQECADSCGCGCEGEKEKEEACGEN